VTGITIESQDGYDISIPEDDWGILKDWPGVDMSKLVVIDGDPHAIRRDTGEPHSMSLADLLLLAKPVPVTAPAQAPAKGPNSPHEPLAKPKAPKAQVLADIVAQVFASVPLRPRSRGLPPIWHKGVRVKTKDPERDGADVLVPLVDHRNDLKGHCRLSERSYRALVHSERTRCDRFVWRLDPEGIVSMRSRVDPMNPVIQDIASLLKMLRLAPVYRVEPL
jgi:hypothetical protein